MSIRYKMQAGDDDDDDDDDESKPRMGPIEWNAYVNRNCERLWFIIKNNPSIYDLPHPLQEKEERKEEEEKKLPIDMSTNSNDGDGNLVVDTRPLVLAVDIECTGARAPIGAVIAVGASVVSPDLQEMRSMLVSGYIPNVTPMEPRCWNEFWSKNTAILDKLVYTGSDPQTPESLGKMMIEKFQSFRAEWEAFAKAAGRELILCTDSPAFDVSWLNAMIEEHIPAGSPMSMPLLYNASDGGYEGVVDVHSMQRGWLAAMDPAGTGPLWKRFSERYAVPEKLKAHTHMPDEDAYGIAFEMQAMLAVQRGRIGRRDL